MDGNSKPHFRCYCHDIPQDTQLSGWYLSHHHWHNGSDSILQQVKVPFVMSPPSFHHNGGLYGFRGKVKSISFYLRRIFMSFEGRYAYLKASTKKLVIWGSAVRYEAGANK